MSRAADGVEVYREAVLQEQWRIASLVDRNPYSRTRGSFSRTHWAWKFEDFPFPRLQEGVYALCRFHDLAHGANPMYQSQAVARWIEWGFEYWASLQHRNGAFDEAYPNEQCLAATAFTGFYLGSAFLRWRERLGPALRHRLEHAFGRAGDWLCHHDETHALISNHLAAAVVGLEVMARITGRGEFSVRATVFLERILQHQSAEGWMREYDGADIGYGTHGFFYLAVYWQLTGCPRTLSALQRFADFLCYFVHPDGTLGGEYGSRNTEFYYPAGFEILAPVCPASAAIAQHLRAPIRERRVCGAWAMDQFNLMPMVNNLLFALDAAASQADVPAEPLPWQGPGFRRYFPECGVWVLNEPRYYAVVGLSKGGTVSVFDKAHRRQTARHAGLLAGVSGRLYTSQDCTTAPAVRWSADGRQAELDILWKSLRIPVFSTLGFLAFRLFTVSLGRFPAISRWVKHLLVAVLIRRKRRPAIKHCRQVRVVEDGLEVEDHLELPTNVSRLQAAEQFIGVHMGSSMYADFRAA
ncbi:MAG TPA: hypothetical protein VFA18_11630, partial [Gemmataceae bacterium]|nr:hypothetical protein [Gemmataceae bacterium]